MNFYKLTLPILFVAMLPTVVSAHGVPVNVSVENGRLIASHPLDQRFAPPIFGQADDSDDFAFSNQFPSLGNLILWDIPGYDIHGMSDSASLAIEVLARPIIESLEPDHRVLWYWNPLDGSVGESPAEFHLLGTGGQSTTIETDKSESLAPFTLANPVAGETGFHNHTLLLYGLDDDSSAPAGVYGFFARLTSNTYTSSDPFLILFNYFADNATLDEAGLAIFEAATVPGDFDLDDKVDGRDFLIWQRLYGLTTRTVADISLNGVVDAADLAIWQASYGTKFGALSALNTVQVPEPATASCLLAMLLTLIARRRF